LFVFDDGFEEALDTPIPEDSVVFVISEDPGAGVSDSEEGLTKIGSMASGTDIVFLVVAVNDKEWSPSSFL
jgi:hypothetical protein